MNLPDASISSSVSSSVSTGSSAGNQLGGGWTGMRWIPIALAILGLPSGFGIGRWLHDRRLPPEPAVVASTIGDPPAQESAKAKAPEAVQAVIPAAPKTPAATAVVHVASNPPGAQVSRADDGEPLGTTPFDLRIPRGDRAVKLLFWKKGFTAIEASATPMGESTVTVDFPVAAEQAAKPKLRKKKKSVSSTTTIDPFN